MGNTSSQPGPPPSGIERSAQKGKSTVGKRRIKSRQSSTSDGQHVREESMPASVLSRGSRPLTPASLQDHVAASAQLLAESAGMPEFQIPVTPDGSDVIMNGLLLPQKQEGERTRTRRSSALDPSTDAGNVQRFLKNPNVQESSKLGRGTGFDGSMDNARPLSRATLSLDDIDENDEGLASLFREYETQHSLPASSTADGPEQNGDSPLSFGLEATDPVVTGEPLGNKRKRKYNRRLGSDVSDISPEQEYPSGTGQHAFNIDFAAFDEIFANEGMHLANPFNEGSEHDLTNGVEPFDESIVGRVDEVVVSDTDAGSAHGNQRNGNLIRITPIHQPRKRRRMEVPSSFDSQIPVYISPYAPNEGQQDRVLPGLEDRQAHSSSEVPFSNAPHPSHGTHPSTVPQRRKQTPPPPLEKPSKPRGNKKQRGGKKGRDYNPSLQELSERGGMFVDSEVKLLDAFRDRYCEENNEHHQRFNDLIQSNIRGNPEVTRLYMALHDELPYRTRQSVIRFCRRHFHNFTARGTWTEDDDNHLRDAITKKGTSWKAVGAMIERFPEDCRDRYRNYLINGKNRKTDAWSHEEIRSLVKAVDFCMRLLQEQRRQAREEKYEGHEMPQSESESDQEVQDMKLINWQVVSERMGGTRSRLQCSGKWSYLKNEDRLEYRREIRRLERGLKPAKDGEGSGSWRLRRAMKKLKNMKPGDKYEFLQAFADCGAPLEKDIRWMALGSKEFRARWSVMDFKAALEVFKKQVPGSDRMSYQEVVNRVLTKLMAEDPEGFGDRWDPDVDGDVNQIRQHPSRREQSERRLWMAQHPGQSSRFKSKEYVDSDDEEEGEEEEDEDEEEEEEEEEEEAEVEWNVDDDENHSVGVGDSAEDEVSGQASPEISASKEEQDEARRSMQPSTANGEDNGDLTDTISSDFDGRHVSALTPRSKVHDASSDDSDDSLFYDDGCSDNDSIEGELVDQLQPTKPRLSLRRL
ncbi:MAG: hypothetical protein Q9185_003688 [Variospora sp. 1 TL-2023]